MVLSMASQLQTEPNPLLKDQILQQMINVLCVYETWKKQIPVRPKKSKAKNNSVNIIIVSISIFKP